MLCVHHYNMFVVLHDCINNRAVVDRRTEIDGSDPRGETPDSGGGEVELRSVHFSYPTRPDVPVFRDFSLRIAAGKVTALVGESGSGKSTIVSLIERFYDVDKGAVLVDGVDVRQLSIVWLRKRVCTSTIHCRMAVVVLNAILRRTFRDVPFIEELDCQKHMARAQVALVSQEPTLFNGTVLDNIKIGKPNASIEEVREACDIANAREFIEKQPDGFTTQLGEGSGISLSGGQKQRIAIARAVLKDPRILLLDEATSALDAESERVVQDALDKLMVGRTSVVIAHRLTTVRNADTIAVVQGGVVLEQGSHDELMAKGSAGAYVQLARAQAGQR